MIDANNDFSQRIQNQTISTEEVLSSSQLKQALSTHFHPIFQWISQNDNLKSLLEWCFSVKHIDDVNFVDYSNASISILSSNASNNSDFLKNKIIINFLYYFLKSKDSENLRLLGLFSRLYTNNLNNLSYFIEQYQEIPSLLVSRIDSIGIQDLITTFLKEGKSNYQFHLFISELTSIMNKSDSASLTLCSIYKSLPKNSVLIKEFFTQSIVDDFVEAAILTKSPFTQSELAKCISNIASINRSTIDFNDDQISYLKLTKENITTLSIECVDIFYQTFRELFRFFFVDERIHTKLISKLQITTENQIMEIAKIPYFVDTLINYYGTSNWCPHCEKLAIEFGSLSVSCKELQTVAWISFYKQNIAAKTDALNNEYGGSPPHPISSTEFALLRQLQMPFRFSPSVKMTISMMSKENDRFGAGYHSCNQNDNEKYYEEEDSTPDSLGSDDDSGEEYAIDI